MYRNFGIQNSLNFTGINEQYIMETVKARKSSDPTLYNMCLCRFVANLNFSQRGLNQTQYLRYLPSEVLIDIYELMLQREYLHDFLFDQLTDLEIFEGLLGFYPARQQLFTCTTALMSKGKPVATKLEENFSMRYKEKNNKHTYNAVSKLATLTRRKLAFINFYTNQFTEEVPSEDAIALSDSKDLFSLKTVDFGLRLGTFLSEAGCWTESTKILTLINSKLRDVQPQMDILQLDCLQRLLHAEASLWNFRAADHTFNWIKRLLEKISPEDIPKALLANTYNHISEMYFARHEYSFSLLWSAKAVRSIDEKIPEKLVIDILRQASKNCVVKRDFRRANMLICQAKQKAKNFFGVNHHKYADTLLDYGFFLLNVDAACQSVNVYTEALGIKLYTFGNRNLHVAIAHEDLAYACYVNEYSTGRFTNARDHVEKAVSIMKDLLPSDHLKLASAKRVKALLLEEIALDNMAEGYDDGGLLKQSEELHKSALQLSLDVFGVINVQTAKHYGNLGRLYQTMNRFEEAERMHQKAIEIKTQLLGPYDYEVGLSIGHLASLYNYQMKKYREAEELYLRSIHISLRLFGNSYSGLEYDYLGLCHVYEMLMEYDKCIQYAHILENWQTLRTQNVTLSKFVYPAVSEEYSLDYIKEQFFKSPALEK